METPSVYDKKSKSNKQIFVEPNCAVDMEVGGFLSEIASLTYYSDSYYD